MDPCWERGPVYCASMLGVAKRTKRVLYNGRFFSDTEGIT